MNWQQLRTSWRRSLAIAMIAAVVVLFGDATYQTWMHFKWQAWLNQYAAAATPTTQPTSQPESRPATQPTMQAASTQPSSRPHGPPGRPEASGQGKPPKPIEVSASIRRRNIFAPPRPPKSAPPAGWRHGQHRPVSCLGTRPSASRPAIPTAASPSNRSTATRYDRVRRQAAQGGVPSPAPGQEQPAVRAAGPLAARAFTADAAAGQHAARRATDGGPAVKDANRRAACA